VIAAHPGLLIGIEADHLFLVQLIQFSTKSLNLINALLCLGL
jgi:hypothetical protein